MEEIQQAIIDRLAESFPDYRIYDDEPVPEAMERPCFVVTEIGSSQQQGVGRRALRTIRYEVRYFPDSQISKHACRVMAEWLYEHLLFVENEGTAFRAQNMSAEMKESILYFSISFSTHLLLTKEQHSAAHSTDEEGLTKP